MRYIIKGGVWKNSEDEILKAAVMKYGLNQWSRISSLLVRKSAKQCKQRWYEWLDPSIKKTEWTREEQEKLLHLAKIFPSQWRTIAPIVGRTPMQCVEQYEKLLDQAQNKDMNDPNDPRRLRPGEIDPNPETKPARPDPIDMDEDEKEMLAEARVRLANTKGKKAKRKARGKLIEEARRLALLQKKRELKAAGIQYINHRIEKHHIKLQDRKYKGINYNRELAFERMVPEYAHEMGSDEEPDPDKKIANVSLQTMEGQRRDEEEEIRRKIDQRRIKKLKERELDQAVQFYNKSWEHLTQNTKLTLPEPQLKDQDLELLGKLNAVNEVSEYTTQATRALVGNYSTRDSNHSVMRTPRVPNSVLREASNIIALQHTDTPLVGGNNAPILQTDVSTNLESQTPNQVASFLRTPNVLGRSGLQQTPKRQGGQTLLSESGQQSNAHDAFKLNLDEFGKSWDESSHQSQFRNPEHERQVLARNELKLRQKLKNGLSNLPKPKNEFTLQIPELDQYEENKQNDMEMDAEDVQKINKNKKKDEMLRRHRQRSQVFQKNLPTPKLVPQSPIYDVNSDNAYRNELEGLLNYQVLKLVVEDKDGNQDGLGDIKEADKLLQQEIMALRQAYQHNEAQLEQEWNNCRQACIYDFDNESYVDLRKIDEAERQRILETHYRVKKQLQNRTDKRQNILNNKLTTLMKGYENRIQQLEKDVSTLNQSISDSQLHKAVYIQALQHERSVYRYRVAEWAKYHDMMLVKANELQSRHQNLLMEVEELNQEDAYFHNE